jgi:hypothetical protein
MSEALPIGQQPVAQIPLGQALVIMSKVQKLHDEFKSPLSSIVEIETELGVGNE